MKIGVLTFWWSQDNYGQILQAYALQQYLKELGHEPFIIQYISTNDYILKKQQRDTSYYLKKILIPHRIIKTLVKNFLLKLQKYLSNKIQKKNPRYFDEFRKNYLNFSEFKYYSFDELKKNPPKSDMYITGSDQIWNFPDANYSLNRIRAYFLDFGNDETEKISYAASFSRINFSDDYIEIIRPLISKFKLVTVREDSGLDVCTKAGRKDAIVVPDPTLLYIKKKWSSLISKNKHTKPYCLIYLVGNKTNVSVRKIKSAAKQKRMKTIYIASQNRLDRHQKIYPTIHEWVGLVKDADFICTNSFHGTIFSIIFNKQFVVFPLNGEIYKEMNTRINSLLRKFNLTQCLFKSYAESWEKVIDWKFVNSTLENEKRKVDAILKDLLAEEKHI